MLSIGPIDNTSIGSSGLTHWGRDKMVVTLLTTSSNRFSWMKEREFQLQISLKVVPWVLIYNNQALVKTMVWCQLGDKPLSDPIWPCLMTHTCVSRPINELIMMIRWPTPCTVYRKVPNRVCKKNTPILFCEDFVNFHLYSQSLEQPLNYENYINWYQMGLDRSQIQ